MDQNQDINYIVLNFCISVDATKLGVESSKKGEFHNIFVTLHQPKCLLVNLKGKVKKNPYYEYCNFSQAIEKWMWRFI